MDFWKTVRVLLRRWRVVVPVFVLSVGVAVVMFLSVRTKYESTGTIVLTPPTEGPRVSTGATGPVDQVNPLLAFDGSLSTSAAIIIQKLQDPTLQEQLLSDFPQAGYDVSDGKLVGPFIVVVASARTPEQAKAITTMVLDRARAELKLSQDAVKAPASTFITPVSLITPTNGQPRIGGKVRFALMALVLSLVASLAAAYQLESIAEARATKRNRRQAREALHRQGSPDSTDIPGKAAETSRPTVSTSDQ